MKPCKVLLGPADSPMLRMMQTAQAIATGTSSPSPLASLIRRLPRWLHGIFIRRVNYRVIANFLWPPFMQVVSCAGMHRLEKSLRSA